MNKLSKKRTIIIIISLIILLILYFTLMQKKDYLEINSQLNELIADEENNIENIITEKNNNKIIIYITGAIKNEGVFEIYENSRIADCIEKAGGLLEEADINNINLAYIVQDGMKIHIPKKGEDKNEKKDKTDSYVSKQEEEDKENSNNSKQENDNKKININKCTQTELETLPGIGPSTAQNIIKYRKENGKFGKIEDIKKVNGIGNNKFEKIKDLIIV